MARLEQRRFADPDIREREHLPETLARMPDSLGDDMLIVQKEFDGFADTRERLDLLALDKERRMVVIENKLDDSGRDVVWQALECIAYCSPSTKGEIVQIYQRYLGRRSEGASAEANLYEFLGAEELDDVVETVAAFGDQCSAPPTATCASSDTGSLGKRPAAAPMPRSAARSRVEGNLVLRRSRVHHFRYSC